MSCSGSQPGLAPLGVLALLLFAAASPAFGQTCTVPGSHASIQQAIDDPACSTIALAAQTYPESINIPRSLTLAGPGGGGAVVEGLVQVEAAGTVVELVALAVQNGCLENAMLVLGGAQVTSTNLEVTRSAALPCLSSAIFADGFESGDTSAWTVVVP